VNRDKPSQTAGRDGRGRFKKGAPAGPGRPAGTAEHRAAMLRAAGPEELEAITATLVRQAREGCVQSAKLVFDRVLGRPPEEQPALRAELPDLKNPEQIQEGMRRVVQACADGELPASHARVWVELLAATAEAGELRKLLEQAEDKPWEAA